VAAPGPLAIGFLHTATGSWTIPVVVLLVVLAAELVVGWPAGRPITLPEAPG
jgi:CP family cyanate transporter-like MFS transporter